MRVVFTTPSISRKAGGLFESVRHLAHSLNGFKDVDVRILGLRDAYSNEDAPAWQPIEPAIVDNVGPAAVGFSPKLIPALEEIDADVVHAHGIWTYMSRASQKWSSRSGRTSIISPRGMLDSWALERSSWKKKLAGAAYENKHLREAACIHALCGPEADAVRAYGLTNPICVIPNGVHLPDVESVSEPPWADAIEPDQKVLLFLGRLHPKKGVESLLEAWRHHRRNGQRDRGWNLAIVGWDDGGHADRWRSLVKKSRMEDSVHFLGPRFGPEKHAALHHADAFILPSTSEGLPVSILEAWSHGLPVLMTDECNMPEGFREDAAIRIGAAPKGIANGLQNLLSMNDGDRKAMGENGRRLVSKNYTWSLVAEQMRAVYQWTDQGGSVPECVTLM